MVEKPVEDELLQRYFDGDLEPAAAAEIAQRLERDEDSRKRLRALSTLRTAVGHAVEDEAHGVDFDALFARIEQGVQQSPKPTAEDRAWWREHIEQQPQQPRVRRILPALGAFAAAAVVLLAVLRGLSLPHNEDAGNTAGGAPQQATTPAPSATPGSEVVQVDFGSNGGTVFEIALDDGNSTPVVWINDGPEEAVQ